MIGVIILFAILHLGWSAPLESGYYTEEADGIRQQTSPNNVPRIGKKSFDSDEDEGLGSLFPTTLFSPVIASTRQKGVPQAYLQNQIRQSRLNSPLYPRSAELDADMIPPPGFLVPWRYHDVPEKRFPLDFYRDVEKPQKRFPPGFGLPVWKPWKPSKREYPKKVRPSWRYGKRDIPLRVLSDNENEEGRPKRAGDPREETPYAWDNIIRSPQGFRFHDHFGDNYYSSRYKRARDLLRELNSVPLIGKRLEDSSKIESQAFSGDPQSSIEVKAM